MLSKTDIFFVDISSLDKTVHKQQPGAPTEAPLEGSKQGQDPRVIQMTVHHSIGAAMDAIGEGATGYWLPSEAITDMVNYLTEACRAGQTIDIDAIDVDAIDVDAIEQRFASTPIEAKDSTAFRELSRREFQVLRQVVNGKTSSQIAAELHLSPKTIDTYRSRLMLKLNVPDLPRLVRLAIREGMLPDD